MRKTTRFDAADYLDTEERQAAYITAALETGDADFVRDALGLVARARGMGQIAKNAGLNRESCIRHLGKPTILNSAPSCHRPCLGPDAFCTPRVDRMNNQAAPGSLRPRRGLKSSRAGNVT
jgi:probable addiction module antidote protein